MGDLAYLVDKPDYPAERAEYHRLRWEAAEADLQAAIEELARERWASYWASTLCFIAGVMTVTLLNGLFL